MRNADYILCFLDSTSVRHNGLARFYRKAFNCARAQACENSHCTINMRFVTWNISISTEREYYMRKLGIDGRIILSQISD